MAKGIAWGALAGVGVWLATTTTVLVSGDRGFTPYPEAWRPAGQNAVRALLDFAGFAAMTTILVAVIVEGVLWRRRVPRAPASAARIGTWTACIVAFAVVLLGTLLGGTTPCAAYGSLPTDAATKCFSAAGLDSRFMYTASIAGWVYWPIGVFLGVIVGVVVRLVIGSRRPAPQRLDRLPPPPTG